VADAIIRARATRWEDDAFPGWIEVTLTDAAGREHRMVDKVPIFTTLDIRSDSAFPTELWIAADTTNVVGDVVTATLKAVETDDGQHVVVVRSTDVRWL
jgi:hypothetical protein